jgi:hypothetical protein
MAVMVYRAGSKAAGPVCGHNAMLKLADLPDWNRQGISAHPVGLAGVAVAPKHQLDFCFARRAQSF